MCIRDSIVDSSSLWVEALPAKTTAAEEVAHVLSKEINSPFGLMRKILTYGVPRSGSSRLQSNVSCLKLNIQLVFTNRGKCKRMNKTITESFRLVCKDQTDWAQNITPVLMSYRATVASPSGISPQFAFLAEI